MGYYHERVNHSKGEYARGEVHENRTETIWSLFCPWLLTFRGVSQDNLPAYVKFFQFLYNHREMSAFECNKLVLRHVLKKNLQKFAQKWEWLYEIRNLIEAHPIPI